MDALEIKRVNLDEVDLLAGKSLLTKGPENR